MRVLKQSTAATVMLGPFLDKTDGVTEEAGLAGTGTELSKAGAAFGAGPVLGTLDSDGWYPISLTTTHTNTLGDLTVKVHDAATHLPVWAHFSVIPANAYDAMVSGSGVGMRSDVQGWLGSAPAAVTVAGVPEVDVTHWRGTAAAAPTVAGVPAVEVIDVSAAGKTDIAAGVWDEDATAHQTQGTFGQAIGDPVADTNTIFKAVVTDAAGATVGVDVVAVKAETASIQTDTNDLQTQVGTAGAGLTNINLPNQTMDIVGNITGNLSGSVGSVTGAVGSVTAGVTVTTNNDKTGYGLSAAAVQAVWDALTSALTTVGSIGKKLSDWTIGTAQTGDAFARLGAPAGASVSADIAAVKTKTDSLNFTAAGKVDANVKTVNDIAINGAGTAGDPWGP